MIFYPILAMIFILVINHRNNKVRRAHDKIPDVEMKYLHVDYHVQSNMRDISCKTIFVNWFSLIMDVNYGCRFIN